METTATGGPVSEARTHNSSNEIKSIGSVNRYYDLNGGVVLATPAGDGSSQSLGWRERLVYDAWNRLVKMERARDRLTSDVVEYDYNGLNWRVREKRVVAAGNNPTPPPDGAAPAGTSYRYQFYSPSWQQLLEVEATGAAPTTPTRHEQQFWGLRGLDDAVPRRADSTRTCMLDA